MRLSAIREGTDLLTAIFSKEFIKLRWMWLALLGLNGLLMAYIFVTTRQLFILDHAEMVWYRVLDLGQIHYDPLRYAPILTGLLLGGIQYLPEMRDERLRLSLHLPISPHLLILAHLLVGLVALGLVGLLDLVALALITARYFPTEAVLIALLTALPWGMAGAVAYLGVTLGLLEPSYKLKLFNMTISAGVVGMFLHPAEPGGYLYVLLYLPLPVLLMIPAVLLPAYRFRYRKVTG
jgi:hypothetical protein